MNREAAKTQEIMQTIANLRKLAAASMRAGRVEEANERFAAIKNWEREMQNCKGQWNPYDSID